MNTELRSWSWWRTPLRPGRFYNASRLTLALAASLLVSFVIFRIWTAVRVFYFNVTTLGWPDYPAYALLYLGLACAAAAIVSFGLDVLASRRREREAATRAFDEARSRDRSDAAELERQATTVRHALAQVYREHHEALVVQAKALLQPDRYGQRDTAAAAREFGYFQDRVAAPALARQGYTPVLVQHAFELDRETLLGSILRTVGQP